ncbi:MAG: hypothetical protein JSR78_16200 [Proteobacteria bacterium]|nr:hypothetical protein [Pseudomonadota bacterium]
MAKAQFGRRGSVEAVSTRRPIDLDYKRGLQIIAALACVATLCYAGFKGLVAWKNAVEARHAQERAAADAAEKQRNEDLTNRLVIHAAEDEIRQMLKDGESARFRDVTRHKGMFGAIVCGYVNSKNSYGAYAGESKFVVNYDSGRRYLIEGANPPAEAVQAWENSCE